MNHDIQLDEDQTSNVISDTKNTRQQQTLEPPHDNSEGNNNIQVSISSSATRDDKIGKFVLYTIQGDDKNGKFEIIRRFSDFYAYRQSLVTRWPGCFVPPIAPRQAVGNLDDKFIQSRTQLLNNFLKQLSLSKTLWYSDESQAFFHLESVEIENYFNNLPKQITEEIIRKYEVNFKGLAKMEINLTLLNTIQNFQQFLKFVSPMLGNFKDIYVNLLKARDNHNDQYLTFLTYLLPEYEKTCLLEYQGGSQQNTIFSDKESNELKDLVDKLKSYFEKNEFQQMLQAIKLEQREIEAFNDCLAQKDFYESQKHQAQQKLQALLLEIQEVIAGKTTIKSIFTTAPKDEQIAKLQIKIDVQTKEIEQLQFLYDMIIVILGYVEIVRFRKEKESAYFRMIKLIAEFELESSKIQTKFWEYILTNKAIFLQQQ